MLNNWEGLRGNQERKRQQEQLRQDIMYRTKMRELKNGERGLRGLMENYQQRAVEAERAGRHSEAVKYAAEARSMQGRLSATGTFADQLETAHTMKNTTQAMVDIMRTGSELMTVAGGMIDPSAMYEAQIGLQLTQQQIAVMTEQQADMMRDFGPDESEYDPAGEEALSLLMQAAKSRAASKPKAAEPAPEKAAEKAPAKTANARQKLLDIHNKLDKLHPVAEAKK